MNEQDSRTWWRRPLPLLTLGAMVAFSACADGPVSPSLDSAHVRFGDAASAKEAQVDVCHRTGNATYTPLSVNANALPAHQAHGDAAPGTAVPDVPGATFDADCVPQTEGDVTGTYVLVTVGGQTLPALGNDEILHGATIVLVADGSCSFRVRFNPVQEDPNGEVLDILFPSCSYGLDGTELSLEFVDERNESDTITATLTGETLVIHDEVIGDLVFVRQ